jgi:hypothetical protein
MRVESKMSVPTHLISCIRMCTTSAEVLSASDAIDLPLAPVSVGVPDLDGGVLRLTAGDGGAEYTTASVLCKVAVRCKMRSARCSPPRSNRDTSPSTAALA